MCNHVICRPRKKAWGGLLGGDSMSVAFLHLSAPQISTMHSVVLYKVDSRHMVTVTVMPFDALRQYFSILSWPLPFDDDCFYYYKK